MRPERPEAPPPETDEMKMDHVLRRASRQDVDSLTECIDAAYSIYRDRLPDLPDVTSGLAESIADRRVWIVEQDGEVIGGMILDMHGDTARLENIAVRPERTGSGIGKALLHRAELDAIEQGKSELRLSTHRDLVENVRLYEHLGWTVVNASGNEVHMSKRFDRAGRRVDKSTI